MTPNSQGRARRAATLVGLSIWLWASTGAEAQQTTREIMRFAADMARDGNWREARFRWEQALGQDAGSYRVLNNLAVACEALGDPKGAREAYGKALAEKRDRAVESNFTRFDGTWKDLDRPDPEIEPAPQVDPVLAEDKASGSGKPIKVTIDLPVPARLELAGTESVLVISFLTEANALVEVNRELVRFLRGEYRKHTALEVLEINPPPAVPEQTLEDLIANSEFWKYLGREYEADLIVSGVATFDRRDHSGFRDVDTIHPATGQKIRSSEFVEQEQFQFKLDVIFMDGAAGTLRFRDRITRSAIFQGSQNDPLTAFFDLGDTLAPELLAIVKARTRQDSRIIFRR